MPEADDEAFKHLLAAEMAKLMPSAPPSVESQAAALRDWMTSLLNLEAYALQMSWRFAESVQPPAAQIETWLQAAEKIARYLRRRTGMAEAAPPS